MTPALLPYPAPGCAPLATPGLKLPPFYAVRRGGRVVWTGFAADVPSALARARLASSTGLAGLVCVDALPPADELRRKAAS